MPTPTCGTGGLGTSETCLRPSPERQPSRVERTYQRAARSCFVQDVVHSEHFRVVTPISDDGAISSPPAPTISPLEGGGFEPSVPPYGTACFRDRPGTLQRQTRAD